MNWLFKKFGILFEGRFLEFSGFFLGFWLAIVMLVLAPSLLLSIFGLQLMFVSYYGWRRLNKKEAEK